MPRSRLATSHSIIILLHLQTLATCKHSLLYDVEKGRGANSLSAPARDLTDYYLLPFEHCIKRANVSAIMCQVMMFATLRLSRLFVCLPIRLY